MRTVIGSMAALLIISIAACEAPSSGDEGSDTTSRTEVRTLRGGSETSERIVRLDDAWMIGEDVDIGSVADIAITGDGRIAVLDGLNTELLVFDMDGVLKERFGGSGEGPGEFSPRGLLNVVATDSSFLVPDLQLQRLNEFVASRGFVRATAFAELMGSPAPLYPVEWRTSPMGGVTFRAVSPNGDHLLRVTSAGHDTLHTFTVPPARPNTLLSPTPIWVEDQQGRVLVGRSDRVDLQLMDSGGSEVLWAVQGAGTLEVPLTASDRRHLEDLVARSAESRGVAPVSVEIPEVAPVLSGILVDSVGQFWLQRARTVATMDMAALRVGEASGFGGDRWNVLSPRGEHVEVVRILGRFQPMEFAGSCIYGVGEDSQGRPMVRRACPGMHNGST